MPNIGVSRLTHDTLVTRAVAQMKQHGMTNIHVDHIARHPQPQQIGRFIPDATSTHARRTIIVEAESQDGLALPHTVEQFKTFHREAARVGGWFVVVVNVADQAAALALVRRVCGEAKNALVWTF